MNAIFASLAGFESLAYFSFILYNYQYNPLEMHSFYFRAVKGIEAVAHNNGCNIML